MMNDRIRCYSDSTLKSMTKEWLINYIRALEDNWSAALKFNEVQASYLEFLYDKASDDVRREFIKYSETL